MVSLINSNVEWCIICLLKTTYTPTTSQILEVSYIFKCLDFTFPIVLYIAHIKIPKIFFHIISIMFSSLSQVGLVSEV